jgi:hypothetical protein
MKDDDKENMQVYVLWGQKSSKWLADPKSEKTIGMMTKLK